MKDINLTDVNPAPAYNFSAEEIKALCEREAAARASFRSIVGKYRDYLPSSEEYMARKQAEKELEG